MNSRRFIASPRGRPGGPESRWARSAPPTDRIAHLGTAAMRDFNPAYDRNGSKAVLVSCRLQCPVCPLADIIRLTCHLGDRHSRNGVLWNVSAGSLRFDTRE